MDILKIFIVFIEGILSVFSPCVLPIIPIYLGILGGSSIEDIKDSKYERKTLFTNSMLFALGIGMTFFILGSSITAITSFITANKNIIMIIGGLVIIIMGFFSLDILKINIMMRDKRIQYEAKNISPLVAFILGFCFSFGWTPCIGPILSSVIIMASSASNVTTSTVLLVVYILGFVIPFIIIALFYNKLHEKINFLKKHMGMLKKISGILIIIIGITMFFGGVMKLDSGYSNNSGYNGYDINTDKQLKKASDFTLKDQNGENHSLADYKGKIVFLNVWATWCPPCRSEMPDLDSIYNEYGKNNNDVIILGITAPNLSRNDSKEEIIDFLNENRYDFPTVIDEDSIVLNKYYVSAFPTTFIINKDGYIEKKVTGAMSKSKMKEYIEKYK